jgi:choice-of-anchor C domain-containing protein
MKIATLFLTMVAFYPATLRADMILNGSFESGPNPGSFMNLAGGSTAIDSWFVTGDGIDYTGTLWQASEGSRSLDLDGSGTAPFPNGGIAQTFATTVGMRYVVQFDMAGNPNSGPAIKPMRVSAAGDESDFFFDITGKSVNNMGWERKTWEFVATSTFSTIEFRSLTVSPNTGWGPALDNVSVTAVPEPSTFLHVALISSISVLCRRNRRFPARQ